MKSEITNTGWKETTVKHFNIETLPPKPFMVIGKWIEINKKLKLYRRRKRCQCCKISWEKFGPTQKLYLMITDKGNKPICSSCYTKIKERFNK